MSLSQLRVLMAPLVCRDLLALAKMRYVCLKGGVRFECFFAGVELNVPVCNVKGFEGSSCFGFVGPSGLVGCEGLTWFGCACLSP